MDSGFEAERQELIAALRAIRAGDAGLTDAYMLRLCGFQYKYNDIYRKYCNLLGINAGEVRRPEDIPYLPITAYRHHRVVTGHSGSEAVYRSSGTTALSRSEHHVRSVALYLENAVSLWTSQYGPPEGYCFLALLPGYLGRPDSSLVSMVAHFASLSAYGQSGFYLHEHKKLAAQLIKNRDEGIPTVLFGVAFALADFAAEYRVPYPGLTIVETGGMKGRRREMSREELHGMLREAFQVGHVYSEYGMTELLSQAYTGGGHLFKENAALRVSVFQAHDPLTPEKAGKPGMLAITDLANIDSCAYVMTEDLGISYGDGTFAVLGRLADADLRGCNLLLEEVV